MKVLEHRVPPPVIAFLAGVMMWAIARAAPAIEIDASWRLAAAAALAVTGVTAMVSGFRAFGRAKTTVNPHRLEAVSALVTSGIYRYTRNPMYVGVLCLLLAYAVYLAVPWTLVGPLAFVLFITRFQIIPEERVLSEKFGPAYADYKKRVRRWL